MTQLTDNDMNRSIYDAENVFGPAAAEIKNPIGLLKERCAAFSGYRAYKFAKSFPAGDAERQVKAMLRPAIASEYENGVRIFYTGMASGFDLWAATVVLELRDAGICPDAQTITVEPFSGQINNIRIPEERLLYEKIKKESPINIILSDVYYAGCYLRRNDYLIDSVSRIICYYDGQKGGTFYTVNHAKRKGLKIINLFSSTIF